MLQLILQTQSFPKVIVMVMTDGPVAPGDKTPLFGGPYIGFTESANPGDTNKDDIVERHLKSFKEQVAAAQEFAPTFINSHSLKVILSITFRSPFKKYIGK